VRGPPVKRKLPVEVLFCKKLVIIGASAMPGDGGFPPGNGGVTVATSQFARSCMAIHYNLQYVVMDDQKNHNRKWVGSVDARRFCLRFHEKMGQIGPYVFVFCTSNSSIRHIRRLKSCTFWGSGLPADTDSDERYRRNMAFRGRRDLQECGRVIPAIAPCPQVAPALEVPVPGSRSPGQQS